MRLFTRISLFVLIALLILYGAVEVAFVLLALTSIFYAGYEYMFMGFCIDCYFAPEPYTFWYTLIMSLIVVGGIFLQPFIRRPQEI
jgi:hypothetical protein